MAGIVIDRNGLEVLDRDECLRLLGTATLGRVGITFGALPVVLPVNFRLRRRSDRVPHRDRDEARHRHLQRHRRLRGRRHRAVLARRLERDGHGRRPEVTEPAALAASTANIARWAPAGAAARSVSTTMISGRRIVRGVYQ